MAIWTLCGVGQRPNGHTFLRKFWQMAESCLLLILFLWNLVYTLWLCGSIVVNYIIYSFAPSHPRFEIRQSNQRFSKSGTRFSRVSRHFHSVWRWETVHRSIFWSFCAVWTLLLQGKMQFTVDSFPCDFKVKFLAAYSRWRPTSSPAPPRWFSKLRIVGRRPGKSWVTWFKISKNLGDFYHVTFW